MGSAGPSDQGSGDPVVSRHSGLTLAGRPVRDVIGEHHAEIVDDVLGTLVSELPQYADLPTELVEGEMRAAVRRAIDLFAIFSETRAIDPDVIAEVTESASRRAEEDAPLNSVLGAYFRGSSRWTSLMLMFEREATTDEVRAYVYELLRFLEEIVKAVAVGFEVHARSLQSEQVAARHSLLDALLRGEDARELAAAAGVELGTSVVVAEIHLARHPDESLPEPASSVARLRKVRRAREEVARHYGNDALWRARPHGGLALLPGGDHARLERTARTIETIAGVDTVVAWAEVVPTAVKDAAPLAAEVLDLALSLGTTSGLVQLDDLALEYQLRSLTSASHVLARKVQALETQPDLLETLELFIANDLNRRRTASLLHVHPNTVDNRLKKVAELTGLDSSSPLSWLQLAAAVAARRALR